MISALGAIPANTEVVFETVSVEALLNSGANGGAWMVFTSGGARAEIWIPLTSLYSLAGRPYVYASTRQVRVYNDPGSTVTFSGVASDGASNEEFNFSVSGHSTSRGSGGTSTNPCPVP